MIKIKEIEFRNILNSVGKIALEVQMTTDRGISEIASTPSAIIPGRREVLSTNILGNDLLNKLLEEIYNIEIENQKEFDNILNNYIEKIGTNICLALSLAFARVFAKNEKITLVEYIYKQSNIQNENISPKPLVTIFSGGVHSEKAKGSIQNIMISVNIHPFSKAVKAITEIYTDIENKLKQKNLLKGYGASSGMIVDNMSTNEKFEMVTKSIEELKLNKEVSIAIDVAAEHFYKNGKYIYEENMVDSEELNEIFVEYIRKYNITYIEDPFDSADEKWWKKFREENPNILLVGDDLFATQEKYINNKLANGIIIKMNQVGTLTGTINAFKKARCEKMLTCVSHRSIETEDTFMCDLAVALNAEYIKIGGPRRGDRITKYNRLLRLEEV